MRAKHRSLQLRSRYWQSVGDQHEQKAYNAAIAEKDMPGLVPAHQHLLRLHSAYQMMFWDFISN